MFRLPGTGRSGERPTGSNSLDRDIRRKADRICSLILSSDYPDVDIDIEIRNLHHWCERHLPDRLDLFELVYLSRFRRLRDQFRA